MIKKTLIYLPANLFPRLATFIVAFLGSHFLSPTEFGYYSLTVIIGELADTVVTNWARIGMARFGARSGGIARAFALRMGLLMSGTAVTAMFLSFILSWFLAPERLGQVGGAVLLYIASMSLLRFGARLLQISQNHTLASAVDSTRAILFVGTTALTMYVRPENFFVISLAGSAINAVIGGASCFLGIRRTRTDIPADFDWRALANFAMPLILVSLFGQMVANLDKIMLKNMYNAAELGRYNLAFAVGRTSFDVIGAAFNTWAFVKLSELINEGDYEKARDMLTEQTNMIYAAFSVTAMIIIASVDLVAQALFKATYYSTFLSVTPIIVLGAVMLNMRMFIYDNIYHLYLRNSLQIIPLVTGAVTSVAIGLWLVPHYGSVGGAFVFAGGSFVALVASFLLSRRFMRVPINWFSVGTSTGIAVACYAGIMVLKSILASAVPKIVTLVIVGIFGAGLLGLSLALAAAASKGRPLGKQEA